MSTSPTAQELQKMANANPGAQAKPDVGQRRRIPMSTPQRKLEVPDIEGYRLYWFKDDNVPRALQAGYEFVDSKELPVNQFSPATSKDVSGTSDLGSQVSVVAGTEVSPLTGQPARLVLMKIPNHFFAEDQKALSEINAQKLGAIFRDESILGADQVSEEDREQAYVKTAELKGTKLPLFKRPVRKAR